MQFEVINNTVANIKTVSNGLVSPADICIDTDNGIIYAPSLQTGLLYAIEVNVTQPTMTTTMASMKTTMETSPIQATVDLSIYGVLSESCEYDDTNNLIYVQRRDAAPNGIASVTSDVTKLASNITEYSFPVVEGIAQNGMVLMDNKLYIANYAGNFSVYDIQNGNAIASEFIATGINGLCNDPDNPMIFYTAAVGIDFNTFQYDNRQGIWIIDTSVTPYNITQILDSNTMINGNPVFPNGCIVSNGVVYLVQTKIDFTGSIVKYDINTGVFSLDGSGIGSADGIVTDGNGKFWISQWVYIFRI